MLIYISCIQLQDYYDFDGGSFYRMLQQQPEFKNTSISKAKLNGSNRKSVDVLDAAGEKAEPILIPSFRCWMGSKDGMQNSGPPYVLPNSYIKTNIGSKNLQVSPTGQFSYFDFVTSECIHS